MAQSDPLLCLLEFLGKPITGWALKFLSKRRNRWCASFDPRRDVYQLDISFKIPKFLGIINGKAKSLSVQVAGCRLDSELPHAVTSIDTCAYLTDRQLAQFEHGLLQLPVMVEYKTKRRTHRLAGVLCFNEGRCRFEEAKAST
jgi:hypothetical protein